MQLSWQSPAIWIALSALSLAALYLAANRLSSSLLRGLHAVRWIVLPYAGLVAGSVSPRLMGITQIDWMANFGLAAGLLIAALAVLFVIRINLEMSITPAVSQPSIDDHADRPVLAPAGAAIAFLNVLWAGAEQFHWSFLRAALWEILISLPHAPGLPAYWASVGAGILILPELWLQSTDFSIRLLKLISLILTGVLFFYLRNFWLCWALHAAVWLLLARGQTTEYPVARRCP